MTASLIYVDGSLVQHSLKTIQYGSSGAAHVYLGSTLVWAAPSTATWVTGSSDGQTSYLAAYTPTKAMTVGSISMVFNIASMHNPSWGIYTASGTNLTAIDNSYGTTSTGFTITAGATLATVVEYTYTKTYTSPYPSLSAGVTYYVWVGERYQKYNLLSGNYSSPGYAPAWAIGSGSTSYTSDAKNGIYLSVVAGS